MKIHSYTSSSICNSVFAKLVFRVTLTYLEYKAFAAYVQGAQKKHPSLKGDGGNTVVEKVGLLSTVR